MNMFQKQQEYSRGAYDQAIGETDSLSRAFMSPGTGENSEYGEAIAARFRKAQEKLSTLQNQGEKEARALNEEYDNLRAKAEEALAALGSFEKNKLGM